MSVAISGEVPATLYENAQPGDWVATLLFPEGTWDFALTGSDTARFTKRFDYNTRIGTITPIEPLDAEQFAAGTVFQFGITQRSSIGWRVQPVSYTVALVDLDDTPPERLRFVSGGVVLANAVGAEIGDLVADDEDTPGVLEYQVSGPDADWFRMVGSTLRLRPGVDLVRLGGQQVDVVVEVSDGRNTAAFTVPVSVLAPGVAAAFAIQDGTIFEDALAGGLEADALFGHAGDDRLSGGSGADSVSGGAGNDTLDGNGGADTLVGGADDDTYLIRSADDLWVESPGGGDDELVVNRSLTMPSNIERLTLFAGAGDLTLTGATGADTLTGNEGRNALVGAAGDDQLNGAAGADTLTGGEGNDRLLGGAEADRLDGGAGADLLAGGDGNDALFGGDAADRAFGGAGADTIDGGAGNDTLGGNDGEDWLLGGLGADALEGGLGNDTLDGGDGADALQGGAGNDSLRAGAGLGDVLRGGAGADTLDAASGGRLAALLIGGVGDDLYIVDLRADQVMEEPFGGTDTVWAQLDGGGYLLPAGVEDLVLQGTASFGHGNALPNRITGNALGNLLLGEAGNDALNGGLGDDTLGGGLGRDGFILDGNAGFDTLLDFTPGLDRLWLPRASFATPGSALAAVRSTSSGAFMTIGPGGGVLFVGLSPAQLQATDIDLF